MRRGRPLPGGRHRAIPHAVSRGRTWCRRAGILLVAAGLTTSGWIAWQYVGTTVVAHHRQRQVVDDLRAHWRAGGGTGGALPGSVRAPGGVAFAVVRIPAFGADYAVPVLEGVDDRQLATGFGHFPGTALPGEAGNLVLGAHRITHGEPLRHLPDLRPGDEVIVETAAGAKVYALDSNGLEVDFSDGWPLADPLVVPTALGDRAPTGQATITLVTCASLFHTDRRLVAFGHLEREEGAVRPRGPRVATPWGGGGGPRPPPRADRAPPS